MDEKEIGIYIDRTYRVVRQDLINRFRKNQIDLTPEQWIIISKIDGGESVPQKEIVNQSFKDKPTVSRIVELLVKKGYLTREVDQDDRRLVFLSLTSEGIDIVEKARPVVQQSRSQGWHNLEESEYDQLISTLNKIMSNYK